MCADLKKNKKTMERQYYVLCKITVTPKIQTSNPKSYLISSAASPLWCNAMRQWPTSKCDQKNRKEKKNSTQEFGPLNVRDV